MRSSVVLVCVVLIVLVACTPQQAPSKQTVGPSQDSTGPMSVGAPAVGQPSPMPATTNATQPLDLSDNLDASIADMEYWVKT